MNIENYFLGDREDWKESHSTEYRKARLILYACLIFGFGIHFLLLMISIFGSQNIAPNSVSSFVLESMGWLFLGMTMAIKHRRSNYKIAVKVAIGVSILVMPFQLVNTGGVLAPSNIWIAVPIMLAGFTLGRRKTAFVGGYWLLYVVGLYSYDRFSMSVPHPMILYIALGVGIGVTMLLSLTIAQSYRSFEKKLRKNEQQETVRLMVTTLTHEISNPLFASILIADAQKEGKNLDLNDELIDSLDRIKSVLEQIRDLGDGVDPIEIGKYVGTTNMIQIKSDEDNDTAA